MAIDVRTQAALALHRFGFSPKAGALASIGDAHAILIAELENPAAGQITKQGLPGSGEAARAAFNFRQEQQAARLAVRGQSQSGDQEPNRAAADDPRSEMMQNGTRQGAPKPNPGPGVPQQIYLEEAKNRLDAALDSDIGFVERLVWFWSNHFCVSADKGGVRPLCGAFEREAIRPHVRGKFADMLVAVEIASGNVALSR